MKYKLTQPRSTLATRLKLFDLAISSHTKPVECDKGCRSIEIIRNQKQTRGWQLPCNIAYVEEVLCLGWGNHERCSPFQINYFRSTHASGILADIWWWLMMHAYFTYCVVLAFAPYSLSNLFWGCGCAQSHPLPQPWYKSNHHNSPSAVMEWWYVVAEFSKLLSPDIFQAFPSGVFPFHTAKLSTKSWCRRVALLQELGRRHPHCTEVVHLVFSNLEDWLPNSLVAKLGCNVPTCPSSEASYWLLGLILSIWQLPQLHT